MTTGEPKGGKKREEEKRERGRVPIRAETRRYIGHDTLIHRSRRDFDGWRKDRRATDPISLFSRMRDRKRETADEIQAAKSPR